MACSRFSYVKDFETDSRILPHTYFIVRLDGRSFSTFTTHHNFHKPNDKRALRLINQASATVLHQFPDILLSYSQSDEVSFIFDKDTQVFSRRESKILSTVVSLFTGAYVYFWGRFMGDVDLGEIPVFDGRVVCYPGKKYLRDYLSWRQADVHVNNLYNMCFWSLVKDGVDKREAERILKDTVASQKNELLFCRFGVNYNNVEAMFRKGSVIYRRKMERGVEENGVVGNGGQGRAGGEENVEEVLIEQKKSCIVVSHEDIIKDDFWRRNSHILGPVP